MSDNGQRQHRRNMSASVANPPHATLREIVSTGSAERLTHVYHCLRMWSAGSRHQRESAMADLERKRISAEDKFAQELGVLVSFLDPHLKRKAESEAKGSDP